MPRIHVLLFVFCTAQAAACDGTPAGEGDTEAVPNGGSAGRTEGTAGQESTGSPGEADTSGPGEVDDDFFEFTVVGAGFDRTVSQSFPTEEAWGTFEQVSVDEAERDRLYLAFPFGSSNIALNLIASGPGSYSLPQDIPAYPDLLDVSFIEGAELMTFRSTDVVLTLDVLGYSADPEARTHAGVPADGHADVAGSFAGTFEEVKANPGDRSPRRVIEASGSFRSGENL